MGAEAWVSEPRLREEVSAGCAGKVPDELCLRCEQCAEEIARIGRPGAQRLAHTLIATHAWPATTPQSTCTTDRLKVLLCDRRPKDRMLVCALVTCTGSDVGDRRGGETSRSLY